MKHEVANDTFSKMVISWSTRRLNAGDIAGGCTSLTWWNKAGARVIRGLVNRRADEYQMCMEGLA